MDVRNLKKYFFFDIDGTLTDNRTKQVVPSVKPTLQALQAAGHFVTLATGRAYYKAQPFMQAMGLHNMLCAGGGALVLNDQLLYNRPLNLTKAQALIQQAIDLGYGVLVAPADSDAVYASNDLFRQQAGPRQESTTYHIDPQFDYRQLSQIFKIYVAIPQAEEARLTLKDSLGYLRFEAPYLVFQYDEKHRGILEVMAQLQAPVADVVVFGDGMNDRVMFDPQWTSIAMGNAVPALKAMANYVTLKNTDDGILAACQHFNWLPEK